MKVNFFQLFKLKYQTGTVVWLSGQCLGLAIQQSSLGFKFLSDHLLGLLSVIPSSNPLPRLCVNSHWLPPASWVFLILPLCSVWVISCYKSFEWGACRLAGQFKHCVTTGGHFAGACVHLLNDNSVGASNLIAGNRKNSRKGTVLLKTIWLVLWLPYFPTKNFSVTKMGRFLRGFFTCRFFSSRFSWPFKDFQDSTPKSHVPL